MEHDKQMAAMALQFFERIDLKGSELGAAVAVRNWLQSKADATPPGPKATQEDLTGMGADIN